MNLISHFKKFIEHTILCFRFAIKRFPKILLWLLWDFPGFRLIWYKFLPPKKMKHGVRPPSSFFLWCVGIYVALFGLTYQRYHNSVATITSETSSILSQLSTRAWSSALNRVAEVQLMKVLAEPELICPLTILNNLFGKRHYNYHSISLLRKLIENNSDRLNNLNLSRTILYKANLRGANLEKTDLREALLARANLEKANLGGAIFSDTSYVKTQQMDFCRFGIFCHFPTIFHDRPSFYVHRLVHNKRASLKGAVLVEANLEGAKMEGIDMSYTNIFRANFKNAHMRGVNFAQFHRLSFDDGTNDVVGTVSSVGSMSNFINTDFSEANLTGRDLRNSRFDGTILLNTILCYTDLRKARGLTVEQLCQARTLYGAKLDGVLRAIAKKRCPVRLRLNVCPDHLPRRHYYKKLSEWGKLPLEKIIGNHLKKITRKWKLNTIKKLEKYNVEFPLRPTPSRQ